MCPQRLSLPRCSRPCLPLPRATPAAAAAAAHPRSARACRGCPGPGRHRRWHHHRRPQPWQPAAEASDLVAVSRCRSWLPAHESWRSTSMPTPVREARDDLPITNAVWRWLSGGSSPLRLAHYPPVITCFRCFLGAQGASEPPPREKPAADDRRHAHTAWRRTQKQRRVRDRPSGSRWRWPLGAAGSAARGRRAGEGAEGNSSYVTSMSTRAC